jgi:hypothetical protein
MFCMLIPVLRFDPITRQRGSTRERRVVFVAPLGIDGIIGGIP